MLAKWVHCFQICDSWAKSSSDNYLTAPTTVYLDKISTIWQSCNLIPYILKSMTIFWKILSSGKHDCRPVMFQGRQHWSLEGTWNHDGCLSTSRPVIQKIYEKQIPEPDTNFNIFLTFLYFMNVYWITALTNYRAPPNLQYPLRIGKGGRDVRLCILSQVPRPGMFSSTPRVTVSYV
jgi:hypothetical protein